MVISIKPRLRVRGLRESVLNRFFEWNSAAVVTEKDASGAMKPLAIATKVDLLTWMQAATPGPRLEGVNALREITGVGDHLGDL
jgi:hypothetical protein